MKIKKPNPGSVEAKQAGCTCPRMDNANGMGRGPDNHGDFIFVVRVTCPIHGSTQDDEVREICRH